MAAEYDRDALRAALALTNPALSSYLDLETGSVVTIDEEDTSPETEEARSRVMDGYGERFRYISGGNPAADDDAVSQWLEGEGL